MSALSRSTAREISYRQGKRPLSAPRGIRSSAVYDPPPIETVAVHHAADWHLFDTAMRRAAAGLRAFHAAEVGRVHRAEKRRPEIYAARSVHRGHSAAAERRMATERNRERRRAARRARRGSTR